MRRKQRNEGRLVPFICVLAILLLATAVAVGVGRSVWSPAQEVIKEVTADVTDFVEEEPATAEIPGR